MVYHYTAVGDSLTFGIGALPGSGFVPIYRRMAEEHLRQSIDYTNLGINGLTSDALYDRLLRDPMFKRQLNHADIITISIGGNDLIRAVKSGGERPERARLEKALERCQRNISGCLSVISRLKSGRGHPYVLRVVGLYNPYPTWDEAAEYVIRFNRYLFELASGSYLGVADVYSRFAGREREMLSFDGIHPSSNGYRVIAEKLNQLGYMPLNKQF